MDSESCIGSLFSAVLTSKFRTLKSFKNVLGFKDFNICIIPNFKPCVQLTVFWCRKLSWFVFLHQVSLGHPNEMFRFPSSSTRKVGSVGRIKKKSKNNFKVKQFL